MGETPGNESSRTRLRDFGALLYVYTGMNAYSGRWGGTLAEDAPRQSTRMEQLVEAHSTNAERLAYLLTGDRELAGDIAQDSFVRLFTRFRDKAGPERFHNYLRSTVVNLCRDHWRKRKVANAYMASARRSAEPLVQSLPTVEMRDELWDALQMLPARQRAALVFRYFEDLSEQQTSEVLGCSVGAVKALVTRGTQAMRDVLEENDE